MNKLWSGREKGEINIYADILNKSITFDKKLYKYDIYGSIAHTKMLSKCKIIDKNDANKIIKELENILDDINKNKIKISDNAEDIHTYIEGVLTNRIGIEGKKLHTARSRNDQVALDIRLYLRDEINNIIDLLKDLIYVIVDKAKEYEKAIMPGYTHLQRAQPIHFSHQILAYAYMFLRDIDRLNDLKKRINICPIGSIALAGTTYKIDRQYEAKLLGFDFPCENSIDGVSDRDFAVEFLSNSSILMMHLSRLSEELILWSSIEFSFIELDKNFTTGSSIMPQKKNPDMAELTRGKTGRIYGNLITMLTILKGLPLAYNKDLQEDKEAIFDTVDNVSIILKVFKPMIKTMKINEKNMLDACKNGFINATDLADYLVKKGMPFRDAYKLVGEIVNDCIKKNLTLDNIPIDIFKKYNKSFDKDVYKEIDIKNCVEKRISYGGTSLVSVRNQIKNIKSKLKRI